ncbi:MAG: agmatine deiminase family protein [Pseudomonadota bacterium]
MTDPTPVRMPAEWEPHERCWMVWPDGVIWEDELEPVERDYTAVAHAIAQFEPVRMIANPHSAARARTMLGNEVEVVEYPVDDAWFRDSGPSFVHQADGSLAGVCWRFNGWGGANEEFQKDAALARAVLEDLGIPAITSALAMEGGAITVDGQGTLMTTDSVVFNANRNPGITREHAEAEFARTLGIDKVIWLPGDEEEYGTNGHIDGVTCFTAPGKALFEQAAEETGDRAELTEENHQALLDGTDAEGRPLNLAYLREAAAPGAKGSGDWGYCLSYVNFYIANGGLVIPKYGIPADDQAREAIQAAFPERQVAQVDITNLARGGGGIHCITQQQPLPRLG